MQDTKNSEKYLEWKKQKPNTKYRPDSTDSRMIGFVFNSPTKPAFKTLASQVVQEMDVFKELQLYLETKGYNSALPIGSDRRLFNPRARKIFNVCPSSGYFCS